MLKLKGFNMSRLENNCLAMVVKLSQSEIKYGEVVQCIEEVPNESVINNGRFGKQVADRAGYWWVNNKCGTWLEHESNLVRLYGGYDEDEMVKIIGKPPTHGASA
jgi:hypothetical protein